LIIDAIFMIYYFIFDITLITPLAISFWYLRFDIDIIIDIFAMPHIIFFHFIAIIAACHYFFRLLIFIDYYLLFSPFHWFTPLSLRLLIFH
jgi:hypothetical protein